MKTKKAFTLIELLVVISIIAMLLAILMPALGMVKKKAQATVCKANQHQWGLCYQLYTHDFNGSLPSYEGATVRVSYMESLRPYYDDVNKMRTCPAASKPSTNNPTTLQPLSFFGSTYNAWQIDPVAGWLDNEDWGIGSFTENSWIRTSTNASWIPKQWGSLTKMTRTSEVPLLLDGRWQDSHVENDIPASASPEIRFYNIGNWWSIRTFMMRRHSDGINAAMADMSSIQIRTEDLWTLKWHRQFEKITDVDLRWLTDKL